MSFFLYGIIILILGYMTYGRIVEKHFDINDFNITPAKRLSDGVDYIPMSWPKIFLIQLLNIAGLGPIFGAIQGALFGPVAFVWIALGCIFAGAVHDYFSGMLSLRHNGQSITEIIGIYLGSGTRVLIRIFSVVVLILVGTIFMSGPAGLLASLNIFGIKNLQFWVSIILAYYFLATILPVDKVIGKLYPVLGLSLVIMAFGIGTALVIGPYELPKFTVASLHPEGYPIWAILFITIACGAISGFHATQTPMMARCITIESHGRRVFYGAMIAEGVIAMIWAAAGMAFFEGIPGLQNALVNGGGPAGVVFTVSISLLGPVGGVLAIFGVIACPITSGDTAFRSARLTIADAFKVKQRSLIMRLLISCPLFAVSFVLTRIDFEIIWRHFAWSNQFLGMLVLWTASVYLARQHKSHWMTSIPATFMTSVCATYLLQAPETFKLSTKIAYPIGLIIALGSIALFIYKSSKYKLAQNYYKVTK